MKLFFALSLLLLSAPSFATSTIRNIVSCELANPIMDAALQVKVYEYTGPGTIGRAPDFSATVQRFGFGRGGQITTFDNLRQQLPRAVGGRTAYVGTNFDLALCTDCAPINGEVRADIVYEINNQRFVEELACDLQ
jgi:hypothetical protein